MSHITEPGSFVILSLVLANFAAQLWKFLHRAGQHRQFDLSLLFSTGGMPSSHSSSVSAVTCSVGLVSGWSSVPFAISLCFALVVIFDAGGLRQAASIQASTLNKIIYELFEPDHQLNKRRLKELLGHTPIQILVGILLGVGVSLGLYWVW